MKLQVDRFSEELAKVLLWLPKNYSEDEVADILGNLWLNPTSTPTTQTVLEIYQAKLRVEFSRQDQFQKAFEKPVILPIPDKIVESSQNLPEALLIFLDGVQPQGIIEVEAKDFRLATCFCFGGKIDFNKARTQVGHVTINFGIAQKQKLQILQDQIVRIPLSFGFSAEVTIKTSSKFKIAGSKKITQKVAGSEIGLIFDARGRPIVKPGEAGVREKRAKSWRQAIGELKEFSFLNL